MLFFLFFLITVLRVVVWKRNYVQRPKLRLVPSFKYILYLQVFKGYYNVDGLLFSTNLAWHLELFPLNTSGKIKT